MEQRAAETEKPPEVEAELPWSPVSPPAAAEAPAIQKPRKAKNSPPEDVHSAPPLVAKAPVATAAAAPALEEAGDSNFEVTKRRCKLCLSRPPMEVSMPSASVLPAVGSMASTTVPTATAAPLPQLLPASASPRQSPKSLDNVPFRVYLRLFW